MAILKKSDTMFSVAPIGNYELPQTQVDNDNSFYVEGTPTRKGNYIGRLKVFLWGGGEIELPIRIIIREKETPSPSSPRLWTT